jgi:DHA1 family tetracycline resistance protein-like MFS transporter
LRKSSVFVVFLTVFIDLLGFGMVVPLLPRYAEHYGASPFQAGLLVATYSIAQFVFAPMWGHLSDRVGRKPVLAATLAGNALSYGLYALADSLPLLFVARGLSGFFGANISTAQAYVADVTTPETRAKGMGMIGMAFGLGFVLGPAMGGPLGTHAGAWAPGAAAALLSAVACAVALTKLPESLTPELRASATARRGHPIAGLKIALGRPELAGLLGLFFFLVFGFANLESMLPLFLKDRHGFDEEKTGYVFAYIGVCIAFAQGFLLSRMVRRFGEVRLLAVGPVLIVIGMQLYWLVPNLTLFLTAIPVVAIGMGLSNPCVASLISKRTPPDIQGRTLGLSQSLGALARAVSPELAGWLYGRFPRSGGSIVPFIWGGAVILVGLLIGKPGLRTVEPPPPPAVDVPSA